MNSKEASLKEQGVNNMAKHLMSFLGTGQYAETTYYQGDAAFASKYILESLIHIVCKDWDWETDKISVFLTDKARESNWEKGGALKDILDSYQQIKNVCGVDIVAGGSENEIWQMFEQMTAAIDEGDELYIDITNSFRFVPLLMTSVAVFARTVKSAEVKAVYYGAFVPGEDRTPILNITGFIDIIDWSQGTNLFVKSGRVDTISDLSLSVLTSNENDDKEIELMMKNLVDMIEGLDNSQGGKTEKVKKKKNKRRINEDNDEKVTILEAYKGYVENKKIFMDKYSDDIRMAPIRKVLDIIDDDIDIFNKAAAQNSYFLMGMCAVSWYIRKGKVQQGYTALDETMKTYVCQRYKTSVTEYKIRETAVQKMCGYIKKALENEKRGISEKDCRAEAYGTWIVRNLGEDFAQARTSGKELEKSIPDDIKKNKKSEWELFESGIVEKLIYEMSKEFIVLKLKIGDQRNSMNHFGYTDKKLAEEPLNELAIYFKEFVDLVERENMGDEWRNKDDINLLSEDILKDLYMLVEDANKFAES